MSDWSFRPPLMPHAILAALFPQWRNPKRVRDERLCREIVARGICAPTEDLGIAVRATLAHVDSLRAQRDDAERRWESVLSTPPVMSPQREKDRARIAELEAERRASESLVAKLRERRPAPHYAVEILGVCMGLLGVTTWTGVTAAIKGLRDEAAALRGIHRDMLRVVGERDEARRELAELRESVRDVARRMAEQISEVSNG